MGDRAGSACGSSRTLAVQCVERAQPGLFAQLITVPLFHEHRILCQVAGHRMNVVKALPSLLIEEGEVRRFADALAEVVEPPSACRGRWLALGCGWRAVRRDPAGPRKRAIAR